MFDGKSILQSAFLLTDVTGVEIFGMSIMHYRSNGIFITRGGSHRIIGNRINGVLNNGISVSSSSGNLLWKNEICYAVDGIAIVGGSVNNHVLENLVTLCRDDGIETFFLDDNNNVLAGNVAVKNGGFGMEIWGDNNLTAGNGLIGNRLGGISVGQGSSSAAVGNLVQNSGSRGCFLINHNNLFFGENRVEANLREGITVLSDFP